MRYKIIGQILLLASLLAGCTLSWVKDDKLKSLNKKYDGVYICINDISAGSDDIVKAGTKVRLYFHSGSNSLKVYAYPFDMPREQALGKNILYLFDTDFPDSKFMDVILDKKLSEILRKAQ